MTLAKIFRFAPTPSGFLHVGNAIHLLATWVIARAQNAQILLRIDDLDIERKRPEYIENIFDTLDWLGLDYDIGPTGPDHFEAQWSQHLRLDLYNQNLQHLRQAPALYACAYSRAQVKELQAQNRYQTSALQQNLSFDAQDVNWRWAITEAETANIIDWTGEQHSLRLYHELGHPIIRQRSGRAAYQIASISDDIHFAITHIVRGADLLPNTAFQQILAQHLPTNTFRQIETWHHPLVLNNEGQKLSKSAGAQGEPLQNSHHLTEIIQQAAKFLGIGTPLNSQNAQALLEAYTAI